MKAHRLERPGSTIGVGYVQVATVSNQSITSHLVEEQKRRPGSNRGHQKVLTPSESERVEGHKKQVNTPDLSAAKTLFSEIALHGPRILPLIVS
jgi:hypothetical protein